MSIKYYVKITGVLLLICAVVAGLLAAVNMLTKDRIEEYNLNKCKQSIISIFPEMRDFTEIEYSGDDSSINKIYEISSDNGNLLGWCVDSKASGYGGLVNVLVGIKNDGKIAGIGILKHSETKGLTDSSLSQKLFDSITEKNSTDVDNISGATYSSAAVKACVDAAVNALQESEVVK
jgi:electron transport complex protein RnfG